MSLTSEIRSENSAIHAYFYGNFNKLSEFLQPDSIELAKCSSIVPSNMKDYPWKEVGHMVEYLLCLSVGVHVEKLMPMTYLKKSQGFAAQKFYNEVVKTFNRSLNADHVDFSTQCAYLMALAEIEGSLRTTGKIDFKFNLPAISLVIVEDMKNIFNNSLKENTMLMGRYHYNPTFALSESIGGADADLIKLVNSQKNILIDIKTTKNVVIEHSWIYQLVGYAFLDKINYFKINDLAVFLPRQNVMLQWSLEEVILKGTHFGSVKEARREFVKALKKLNEPQKNLAL